MARGKRPAEGQLDLFASAAPAATTPAAPAPPPTPVGLPGWAAQRILQGEPTPAVQKEVTTRLAEARRDSRPDWWFINVAGVPVTFDVLDEADGRKLYRMHVSRHGNAYLRPQRYELQPQIHEALVPASRALQLVRAGDVRPTRMLCGSLIAAGLIEFDDPLVERAEKMEAVR